MLYHAITEKLFLFAKDLYNACFSAWDTAVEGIFGLKGSSTNVGVVDMLMISFKIAFPFCSSGAILSGGCF